VISSKLARFFGAFRNGPYQKSVHEGRSDLPANLMLAFFTEYWCDECVVLRETRHRSRKLGFPAASRVIEPPRALTPGFRVDIAQCFAQASEPSSPHSKQLEALRHLGQPSSMHNSVHTDRYASATGARSTTASSLHPTCS
jgi:hypothetical protein